MIPFAQLPYALENGFVDSDTLYFNNTVQTKAELEEKWLIPLKDSWLASRLPGLSPTAGAAAPMGRKS
jgi:hypothetical protein